MLRFRMAKTVAALVVGLAALLIAPAGQAAADEPPQVAEAPAAPVVPALKTDMGWQ
ncbi:hypothetical protein AB0O42_24555 [Streptomyces sp. NPDC089922]|uniref:hypothetical protein n=1 Tax=unclassified Streptomyces TaxID=2593676 RepID=UPI00344538EC